jgi:hypothetical protein
MTDYKSHHELDDELLSAYLDDELSPEERASVDARLLEDPAAQQLLHQLRAVSQSVQALPQEVVGHDLGEAVLRKVEQSRRTSATAAAATTMSNRDSTNGASTQLDGSVPTFTIGRSRRGWVWASLAVAAALLIMAFQADQNANMPAVAQRKDPQAGEESTRRMSRSGELEFRNLGEPAAAPAETDVAELDAAAPAAPAGTTSNLNVNGSVNGPMPASGIPPADGLATDGRTPSASEPVAPESAPADELAADSRAYSEEAMQAGRRSVAAGGEVAEADSPVDALAELRPEVTLQRERSEAAREAPDESVTASDSERLVVVRVLARPDALRSKSFDQLLATNGIQVTAEEAKEDSTPADAEPPQNRFAVDSELRNVELRDQQLQESGVEEDLVLVEASPAVIASCLEGLNRDSENYLGLEVGDSPVNITARGIEATATADDSPAAEAALAKKLGDVSDWTRYNRGTVPPPQRSLARDKDANLNYRFYAQNDDGAGRGRFGGGGYGVAGGLGQLKQESEALVRERSNGTGQARRLRLWGTEARQSGQRLDFGGIAPEERAGSNLSVRIREAQRELKSAAQPADTLQVLFVLSPSEEPVPTLKARNKAQ